MCARSEANACSSTKSHDILFDMLHRFGHCGGDRYVLLASIEILLHLCVISSSIFIN